MTNAPDSITPEANTLPARNVLRNELRAQSIVIPTEDPLDWDEHCGSILESYEPRSALEHALALRVAELIWRLRRVSRSEADSITNHNRYIEDLEVDRDPFSRVRPTPAPQLPRKDEMAIIARYEGHLNRQLLQTMHELEALQDRRNGKRTPLARVDFLSMSREQ